MLKQISYQRDLYQNQIPLFSVNNISELNILLICVSFLSKNMAKTFNIPRKFIINLHSAKWSN